MAALALAASALEASALAVAPPAAEPCQEAYREADTASSAAREAFWTSSDKDRSSRPRSHRSRPSKHKQCNNHPFLQ